VYYDYIEADEVNGAAAREGKWLVLGTCCAGEQGEARQSPKEGVSGVAPRGFLHFASACWGNDSFVKSLCT